MNKYFRYMVMTKNASVSETVQKALEQKGFKKNIPTYSGKIKIAGALPGVAVQVPDNPIVGGKYNVFFQIRPGANATKSGINTILVSAEAGGMASAENTATFGNSDWIKKQLSMIQAEMTKQFGNVSLGKVGISSFSGGYDAVGKIISDPTINSHIDSVVVLDGIHHGKRGKVNPEGMKPWTQFAEKAKNDPTKKFVFVYTAVDPEKYSSTSDSAAFLNQNVGAKQVDTSNKTYAGVSPSAINNAGGYTAIQLFPRKSEKGGYGYTEQEQKKQHITAARALPDVLNEYLQDWNS